MNQVIEDNQANILHYWHLVRSRLWALIALAIVVTVLAGVLVNAMTPVYKATATMLLEPEQAKAVSMEDMFAVNSRDVTYFNTQAAIIYSRSMLEKVIDELDMARAPALTQKDTSKFAWLKSILKMDRKIPSEKEKHQQLLSGIRKNIEVKNLSKTKLMELSYESSSPEMAANVANTLAEVYMRDGLEARVEMMHQATAWMSERADALRKKLNLSENRLQAFIEREGLVNMGEGVASLTSQELTALTERSLTARARVSELNQRYGSKHPKLIAARSELARAEAAMHRGKSKIRALGRKDVQLKALQHEVKSTRQLYETFLNRLKETDQSSTLKTATARMIDPAIVPLVPIKPKKKLIVSTAFVLSLVAGIGLIFLLDLLDSTIRSIEQVESKLGMPVLGLLPLLKLKSKKQDRAATLREMASDDNHQFSEAIRTIRTGIMLSAIDNPHKVILVTSSTPDEGKSTVAANLAIAMGRMERVLLLDADLRRPSIAKQFGMDTKENGLSELVAGTAKFKDCLERNEAYNIDVIHSGLIPPNPLELLASNRFKAVLASLEKHYDRIIIDSTPVQAVSDALVLSQHARGVVYVVKADSTSDHVIKTCVKRLREVDAPIIGVVLNQLDTKKSDRYGYYGYGGYYDEYGYSDKEKKA